MSATRDTGFLRNAIQVTNQGVTFVSGSTTLMSISSSGAVTTTGVISGSNALSASFSLNSALLNGIGSVGFATTGALLEVSSSQQQISSSLLQVSASYISLSGSYTTFSGSASTRITVDSASLLAVSSSQQQISASLLNVIATYATTGSNSFRANQSITGSLVVSSTITAQTLVVQTVTSSIVYSSGSNIFGSALGDRQTFTGSLNVTGSQYIFGNVGIGTTTFTAGNGTNLEVANSSVARVLVTQTGTRSFSLSAESNAFYLYDQTANATRLYVSGSGLVGINTTSPSYQLDVNGTGRFVGTLYAANGNILTGADANYSGYSAIGFGGSVANGAAKIFAANAGNDALYISGPTGQGITFRVNGSPTAESVKFLSNGNVILGNSGGNVGIGTSSPSAISTYTTLDIRGATGGGIKMGVSGSSGTFNIQKDASDVYLNNVSNGNMYFFTNDAERMRITSGGYVGIGTTTVDQKFVVQGPANNWTANFIGSTTSGQSLGLLVTAGTTSADHAMIVQSSNSATTFFRIAGNGNVLIGTTTDYSSKLVVIPSSNPTSSTGSNNQISIGETSNNTGYCLKVGYINTGGGYQGSIQSIAGGSGSTLFLNASGGNVLIGTTSDDTVNKLQVQGSASIKSFIKLNTLEAPSVSTSAVTISTVNNTYGGIAIVWGNNSGNIFTDLVFYSLSSTYVINGQSISGSPVGRTYTCVSGDLKLAMASGTYSVRFQAIVTT